MPEFLQNLSKIIEHPFRIGSRRDLGPSGGPSEGPRDRFLIDFGVHFGSHFGAEIHKNRKKNDLGCVQAPLKNGTRFWMASNIDF